MTFKKLTLTGFKSFASRTVLEFDRGITAIVGPNGSGKSNIADAIRWVLGEQSKKSLRSKKGEDVIFAGSQSKKSLGRAEVALHLDRISAKSKKAPKNRILDFPEITLKRRFYRNGEGEFFLNRASVRLKDIEQFLTQTGAGQKTYSVIGQGMIDKIVDLGPQEKRELFLEASGAKHLELKKREAENKLKATEENIVQVLGLTSEIEPHLKRLKRQALRAAAREKTEKKLKAFQKTWYSQKIDSVAKKQQKVQSGKRVKEEKAISLENKISNLKALLQKQERSRKKAQEIWQNLYLKKNEFNGKENEIQKNIAILEGRLEALNQNFKPREQIFAQSRELEAEIQKLNQEIKTIEKNKTRLAQKLKNRQKELLKINEQKEDLQKRHQKPEDQTIEADLNKLLAKHQTILKTFERGIDAAKLKTKLQNIYDELKGLIERLKAPSDSPSGKRILLKLKNLANEKENLELEISKLQAEKQIQGEKAAFLAYQKRIFENKIEFLAKKSKIKAPDQKKEVEEINLELKALKARLEKLERQSRIITKQIEDSLKVQEQSKEKVFGLERNLRKREDELAVEKKTLEGLNIESAQILFQKQNLESEARKTLGLAWNKIDLDRIKVPEQEGKCEQKINRLKRELELIGSIDPETIKEYEKTQKRFDFLNQQAQDLEKASLALNKLIKKLNKTISFRLNQSFQQINFSFKKYFRLLFAGGRASLAQNQEEGIVISASPPGKRLKNLSMLSGGEKSLVGLALIFSILKQSQPPFCILDEVDAALDEANSVRFARILKQLSRKIQLIAITHNRETMKQARVLYGVTMGKDGVSKLLSMKLEK